jgi:hypothetical protein
MKQDTPAFKDEKFMSADEKLKTFRAWVRFLRAGCTWDTFTQALYHHLYQHCSFIAHTDRAGFYAHYFCVESAEATLAFLDQFDPEKPGVSVEYRDALWLREDQTGSDLSHAMRKVAGNWMPALRAGLLARVRDRDLAQAKTLLEKHGIKMPETKD